jgi:hypothetical protein
MKTFIAEIIPKIQRYSKQLDDLTLLTNQHWVLIENIEQEKRVYLFRKNNELLISVNGKVTKGKWEYLGNNSLLIDQGDQAYLFKHGFFDENLMALKIDSKEEYALFVNENKYNGEFNSSEKILNFLTSKYILNYNEQLIITPFENDTTQNKPELTEEEKAIKSKINQKEFEENMDSLLLVIGGLLIVLLISLVGTYLIS